MGEKERKGGKEATNYKMGLQYDPHVEKNEETHMWVCLEKAGEKHASVTRQAQGVMAYFSFLWL